MFSLGTPTYIYGYNYWKMGKSLEWHTKLPLQDRPETSPVFIIQNVECCFYFSRNYDCFYHLYVRPKATNAQLKSFYFTIYVNYNGASSNKFTEHKTNFSYSTSSVLKFSEALFLKKTLNLTVGFPVKYIFVFEHSVVVFLPPKIQTEDKAIQTGSYMNTNVSTESFPDDFSKLLETGSCHDVEVKCGEHSLNVHKVVLCARSEVFKTMLQSDFLEGQTGVVQFQDMDESYFHDFMHYLYTGSMPELTFEEAKTLYEAGDKYAVRSLMLRCSEYLQDNLSEENLFECFVLSDAHSDQKLKDAIKTFVLEKKIYLEEDCWAPFCEKFPTFATDLYRQIFKRKKVH